ncbi:MAG TPA: lasso peptide biosynthesis B2 protein [Kofleriaceae bacterium]|nr:lasso peptide biosynthesis B2 protein [Kofleriaceae bacterium]
MFLDLRADRYSCLAPGESEVVRRLAGSDRGRPGRDETAGLDGSVGGVDVDQILESLAAADILTPDPRRGRPLAAPPPVALSSDMVGYPLGRAPEIRAGHVARFLAAASATAARLRWRSLVDVVARVRDRKRRRGDGAPGIGPDQLRELVEVYKRLRPLMFTSRDHCLHDSLVLLDFLAAHGQFPLWVVGVRMGPFAAHSWVQHDGVVLNDAVANVARFTPILMV